MVWIKTKIIALICIIMISACACSGSINGDHLTKTQQFQSNNSNEVSIISEQSADIATDSDLPIADSKGTNDYYHYLNKIWVVDQESYGEYDYFSFHIEVIGNGKIEGKYSLAKVAYPDFYFYRLEPSKRLGSFTGVIENNIAKCEFEDEYGNAGDLSFILDGRDELEVTIDFEMMSEYYKDDNVEGVYIFRPFNIEDIKDYSILNEYLIQDNFKNWGTVNLVPVEINDGKRVMPVVLLTNENNDILYIFSVFHTGSRIIGADICDVNGDGFKDIQIVTEIETEKLDWSFLQLEDGLFYMSDLACS